MRTYTIGLAPRLPHSQDVFTQILDAMDAWNCFPDEPAELIVRVAAKDYAQTVYIDKRSLGMCLWVLKRWNPSNKIRFEGRAA